MESKVHLYLNDMKKITATSVYRFIGWSAIIVALCTCENKKQDDIVIGTRKKFHSTVLGEDRSIWIHVPERSEHDTTSKFPVLYLLDGDSHFYSMVGLIHQMSSVNGNDVCPKMIVVGIPNTIRARDLTPTHVSSTGADSTFYKLTGGGDKFIEFISTELIPYIEKNYPAGQERILVGHSLGGLMAIDVMINHKDLFHKFISIDPSLWWDNHKPLIEYEAALDTMNFKGKSLFIGVANTIEMDTVLAMRDTLEKTDHFRSIIRFVKALKKTKSNVDWNYRYYADEGHGSVPLITEYDALHYLYRKIAIELDPAIVKTYEGTYRHQFTEDVDSFIEISAVGGKLILHERWSGRKIAFIALSETDFYATESQFPLRFIKNNSGAVTEVLAFNRDVWKKM